MALSEFEVSPDAPMTQTQLAQIAAGVIGTTDVSLSQCKIMLCFGGRQYDGPLDHDAWIELSDRQVYLSFRDGTKGQINDMCAALAAALVASGVSAEIKDAE